MPTDTPFADVVLIWVFRAGLLDFKLVKEAIVAHLGLPLLCKQKPNRAG